MRRCKRHLFSMVAQMLLFLLMTAYCDKLKLLLQTPIENHLYFLPWNSKSITISVTFQILSGYSGEEILCHKLTRANEKQDGNSLHNLISRCSTINSFVNGSGFCELTLFDVTEGVYNLLLQASPHNEHAKVEPDFSKNGDINNFNGTSFAGGSDCNNVYSLTGVLHQQNPETETLFGIRFTVANYDEMIPQIHNIRHSDVASNAFQLSGGKLDTIETVADVLTSLASVSVELDLLEKYNMVDDHGVVSEAILPIKDFDICVRISTIKPGHEDVDTLATSSEQQNNTVDTSILPLSCIQSSQTVIVINNLHIGKYSMQLILKDLTARYTNYSSSARSSNNIHGLLGFSEKFTQIEVHSLLDKLPTIVTELGSTLMTPSNAPHQPINDEMSNNDFLDFVVTDLAVNETDVTFDYNLVGFPTAIAQVELCLQIIQRSNTLSTNISSDHVSQIHTPSTIEEGLHSSDHDIKEEEMVVLPLSCIPSDRNSISLKHMKVGNYSVHFELHHPLMDPISSPQDGIDSRRRRRSSIDIHPTHRTNNVVMFVQVRRLEEFVPTYDWQPLRAWHTIPAGIETRLPIGDGGYSLRGGGGGAQRGASHYNEGNSFGMKGLGSGGRIRKEARIPQPWRLQLPMPSPCKYFLRMDLYRHTILADIRKRASDQCKFPPECFLLYGDETLLDPENTVEETKYFSTSKTIELQPDCLKRRLYSQS